MRVWVQKWEESEAGWGCRPDGFTLHAKKEHIDEFLKDMRAREMKGQPPGYVPEEYSRPCGEPYEAEIEEPALKKGSKGVWGHGEYPKPVVPDADKTGWVVTRPDPKETKRKYLENKVSNLEAEIKKLREEIRSL